MPKNVEIDGKIFQKSSLCTDNCCCVVVSREGDMVYIADSKNPNQKPLEFTNKEFEIFKLGAAKGDFDK